MSPVKRSSGSRGDTLVVMIGARGIVGAALHGAAWRADSRFEIALEEANLPSLGAAIGAIPVGEGIARMRVVVADSWLACTGIPWSAALSNGAEAQRMARTRLALAGFELDAHDVLRLDDAPFGAPRLALAYPAPMMAALFSRAAEGGIRLDSVLALSAAAWPLSARAGAGALAILDQGLIVLASGAGCMDELTVRQAPAADVRQLQDAWQRQCLRDPRLAALEQVAWLDLAGATSSEPAPPFAALDLPEGDMPPGLRLAGAAIRRSALDATEAPPLPRGRALLLAAAAALALAGGAYAVHAGVELQALKQARQTPARTAPPVRAVDWSTAELARVQAVNVAVRELNLPFEAMLRALEPPKDVRVAVLSMTTAASTSGAQASRVRIVAETRTGAEMARYVAFVAERRPFTGAYLVAHEIDEAAAERPYRFTLEATWND